MHDIIIIVIMNPHLVVEVPGDEGGAVRDAGDDAPERHAPALVDMKLPVYWHCCCWLGWVLQTRLGTVRQAGAGAGAGAGLPGTTASHTLSLLVSHTCTEGVSVVPSLKPMV